jgi:hypothetical protein
VRPELINSDAKFGLPVEEVGRNGRHACDARESSGLTVVSQLAECGGSALESVSMAALSGIAKVLGHKNS